MARPAKRKPWHTLYVATIQGKDSRVPYWRTVSTTAAKAWDVLCQSEYVPSTKRGRVYMRNRGWSVVRIQVRQG